MSRNEWKMENWMDTDIMCEDFLIKRKEHGV
jgi:hypothetical protein